jgi:hypothetical protein
MATLTIYRLQEVAFFHQWVRVCKLRKTSFILIDLTKIVVVLQKLVNFISQIKRGGRRAVIPALAQGSSDHPEWYGRLVLSIYNAESGIQAR